MGFSTVDSGSERKAKARALFLKKQSASGGLWQAVALTEWRSKGVAKKFDKFILDFKANQSDGYASLKVCQRWNDWISTGKLDKLMKDFLRVRQSINNWCNSDLDDALGWNWDKLMALYLFLTRQEQCDLEDVKLVINKLREVLLLRYQNEEELDKQRDELNKLFGSKNRRTRARVARGFSHTQRKLFLHLYLRMEGVVCTSQCFYGYKCGWCDGCNSYRAWYKANNGDGLGIDPPAPPTTAPLFHPRPTYGYNAPYNGQDVDVSSTCTPHAWPTGASSGNGGAPNSHIWAARK